MWKISTTKDDSDSKESKDDAIGRLINQNTAYHASCFSKIKAVYKNLWKELYKILKILKYLQMDAKVNIKVAITVIIYQSCVMNLICKILLLRGLEHLNLNDV